MLRAIARWRHFPGVLLIAGCTLGGLLVFRDYGLSWDEPLFYDYARSIRYAYSPREWFGGDFVLERAFGPSAEDHANRGPAHLLLAYPLQSTMQDLGLDLASAWHLTNFLTFIFGVFVFYQLCTRWLEPWSSFGAAALLATQPLLWGHSFMNPKDSPFMVWFIASIWLGLLFVDAIRHVTARWRVGLFALAAGGALGICSSIRVLAPFAGGLVILFGLLLRPWLSTSQPRIHLAEPQRRKLWWIAAYVAVAAVVMFITWPYLWPDPLTRIIEVSGFMADNPTQLAVLFQGNIYPADALPRRYLPTLLAVSITESALLLALAGLLLLAARSWIGSRWSGRSADARTHSPEAAPSPTDLPPLREMWLAVAWFLLPFGYVMWRQPPMYDGYRHFLFILPPLFVLCGLALQELGKLLRGRWLHTMLVILMIAPGLRALSRLHPYEYAYFNSLAGGMAGAFRHYELDYWLTCYKESMEALAASTEAPLTLYVRREPRIAQYYAPREILVHDYRLERGAIVAGDYILVNTRANEDLRTFRDAPVVVDVGREGASFCLVKLVNSSALAFLGGSDEDSFSDKANTQ